MGFEYRLDFTYADRQEVDALLRGLEGFEGRDEQFGGYYFRAKDNDGQMPDLEARIDEEGLYVCVYGGAGGRFLRRLMSAVLSEYDRVTAAKLDWE